MKLLESAEGHLNIIERYDFNDIFSLADSNQGLVICYELASSKMITLKCVECSAHDDDVGVQLKWCNKYTKKQFFTAFKDLNCFLAKYDNEDFGDWIVDFTFRGSDISACGKRSETKITVMYPKAFQCKPKVLFKDVEDATYQYHNFGESVINVLTQQYKMSEISAIKAMKRLMAHPDIGTEFIASATGSFPDAQDAICVEGFTAENLSKHFPLSMLDSYFYLIYLREFPEEAAYCLKCGLR